MSEGLERQRYQVVCEVIIPLHVVVRGGNTLRVDVNSLGQCR